MMTKESETEKKTSEVEDIA